MKQFQQKLVSQIKLTDKICVGEEALDMSATPGKYNVYRLTNDDGEFFYLYAHEDSEQEFDKVHQSLDIVSEYSVDGGSYGIVSTTQGSNYEDNRRDYHLCYYGDKADSGFVTRTNYGDGSFALFSNEDNSVFIMDDLLTYIDNFTNGYNAAGLMDEANASFVVDKNKREVIIGDPYRPEDDIVVYAGDDERLVDALVRGLNILAEQNDIFDDLEWDWEITNTR